ncbi:MAG: hypothetical protein B7Z78_11970 [Rhodospirillales bacterium 20-60-12]|nr:MAG: hypothetical protein B7Z78_11970 [Rhodospirillales bacterium 20-60-12]HQT66938.1 type VI secretion system baseplate subunit TssG [Acetobacteraceae bacterium]HQU01634.1 type VI secretion system baseplate subunit TssG [Acetobacteraceae bacterium]
MTPLDYLRRQPHRFSFDAAVRLLWRQAGAADPGEAIDFVSQPTLVHPVAEVEAAEPATPGKRARMTSRLIGLVGPSGMLPRWYTELVAQSVRARAPAIGDFFDMIAQRLIGHFAWAGAKYRPARAAELTHMRDPEAIDPLGGVLLALAGHGTSHMVDRLSVGPEALQHYAGFFAARPRSADRLAALASDWLGRPVELHEFIGVWLPISPDQRSKMPNGRLAGRFNQLGLDVAAGVRAYDPQARFVLRIGPLNKNEFEALLPDREALGKFVSLIRAYVGMELDFAVNLVLARSEIPVLQLGGKAAPRLGWTSWLPAPNAGYGGYKPADEAIFSASLVELVADRKGV